MLSVMLVSHHLCIYWKCCESSILLNLSFICYLHLERCFPFFFEYEKKNGDWSAAGNCILSDMLSGVGGRPFCLTHNRQCVGVGVAVTTLGNMESDLGAQSCKHSHYM